MLTEEIARTKTEIENYPLKSAEDCERFRLQFTVRKGAIAALFDELSTVPTEDRRVIGQQLNELKQLAKERENTFQTLSYGTASIVDSDYSLPPVPHTLGSRHPLSVVQEQIVDIFGRIGFSVATGPEIEDDWHNFSALNFPPDHPAREMQDTFFVQTAEGQEPKLLRTHTSTVQVRLLDEVREGRRALPIRAVMPGRVYRNEAISARAHQLFHQIEGLYIDRNVSFADLKQAIYYFLTEFYGADVKMRMRPSYFPFTERSAEVDVSCQICGGPGCNICKYTGWVEVLGCGMVDPAVLEASGVDPNEYSGFAFGIGIERTTMGKYTVKDLRLFTENDVRFLRQFESL
ncbi:MAG: phenylalanine--tRNA ligase subunit alpha [Hymenobacteraceae bacterium]|nr:phenylalanine--tRNA ligase subunit alpha [Hymenobacteraceae bacterium]